MYSLSIDIDLEERFIFLFNNSNYSYIHNSRSGETVEYNKIENFHKELMPCYFSFKCKLYNKEAILAKILLHKPKGGCYGEISS